MDLLDVFYILVNFIAIYLSLVWIIVYIGNRKEVLKNPKPKRLPSITFLVPAFNEQNNIERCLKSILNLDYPKTKKKIIVINDGSTDNTAKIVRRFKKHGVKLINQKNSGKSVALNNGMKYVRTELVACMDADSYAEMDYLKKTVGYFQAPKVGAVTTSIKTDKMDTIARKIQWVEYLASVIMRKLFSILDSQFVVPGAGGIFRTGVLRKIGPFDVNNITEDMEIALRLQSKGYRIENSIDASVYTSVPSDFKTLFKQRMRWYRGYIDNFKTYTHLIGLKYGNFGTFLLPGTIAWAVLIAILFILMFGNTTYEIYKSFSFWFAINNQIMLPQLKLDIFEINTVNLLISVSILTGITLSIIGIRASKPKNVRGRKILYIIFYFLIYPLMFSFFWFCAFVLHLLKVDKKW